MKLSLTPNRSYKITIPKKIVEALQWKNGDDIIITIEKKHLILKNNK
jgi:AbrB family looped-hinge helix DNA binding protein